MNHNFLSAFVLCGAVGLGCLAMPRLVAPTDTYIGEELGLITTESTSESDNFYFLLQPSDCTTVDQGTAIFSCMTNVSDVSYRWQSYTPSSGAWNDSIINDSAYSPTLTFTAYTFRNGYMYRCVATNNQTGQRIVSNTATLWVETDSKSLLPIYDPINDPLISQDSKSLEVIDNTINSDIDKKEESIIDIDIYENVSEVTTIEENT